MSATPVNIQLMNNLKSFPHFKRQHSAYKNLHTKQKGSNMDTWLTCLKWYIYIQYIMKVNFILSTFFLYHFLHASLSPETEFWTSSSKIGTIRLSLDIKLYFITNLVNRWHKNVSFCKEEKNVIWIYYPKPKKLDTISAYITVILIRMHQGNY